MEEATLGHWQDKKKMKDSEDYEKLPDTTVTRAARRNRRLRYTAVKLRLLYR